MPRIHRVPFCARLSETAMANLKLMAGQARVRPATMGADLLEGLLAVPTPPGSSPAISTAPMKEILFRSVYATHLLEGALQKNRAAIRAAKDAALAEVESLLATGKPNPEPSGDQSALLA